MKPLMIIDTFLFGRPDICFAEAQICAAHSGGQIVFIDATDGFEAEGYLVCGTEAQVAAYRAAQAEQATLLEAELAALAEGVSHETA